MNNVAAALPTPGGPYQDAAAVFARLRGDWTLTRTISSIGAMTGRATFVPLTPGVLRYREEGRLELASGHRSEAYREYYYLLEDDHIHVTFSDAPPGERTFLRLFPNFDDGHQGARAGDVHHCGCDTYAATYIFESEHRLVVTMDVHGPSKGYVIHTTLTRIPGQTDETGQTGGTGESG
jgi:hypothetical protein